MGSVNPIQRTVKTAHLSVLMTVHSFSTQYMNTTQNSSENLPSYLLNIVQGDTIAIDTISKTV